MIMKIEGAHVVLHGLLKTSKDCPNCKRKSKDYIQAVLLCKRTQDAPIHPGYWGLFGGTVDNKDKTPLETAYREVCEELAVIGADGKELQKEELRKILKIEKPYDVPIRHENGKGFVRYFSSLLDIGMDKLLLRKNEDGNKVEGEGLGWFTAEETHHLLMRPEDRVAVIKFFKNIGV